uniref:SANTA domain-containing protein n=1 Tax=Aegilops tauschii subsp. strangulata TaxID=200361 RepID=A0A453BSX3_AEGTS
MRENGFSVQICEQFMIGFPFWWETWDSHMESYPNCFIDPREGSAQFYLEKFQLGNFIQKFGPSFIEDLLNNAKNFPIDHLDAFTESSRFQEYICGNDASTKENSAASDDARPATVANVEIGLTASSISQERDHVDIECNVSLAPAETYTGDETCKEAGNQNDTMHPDAREEDAGSHLFNSDWTCTMCPDHMPNDSEGGNATSAENATMSPDNMPNDSEGGNVTSAKNATMSPDHMSPDNMPNDSEGGNATGAENSVELLAKYPLAIVPPENANCCSEIPGASQSVEPSSMCRSKLLRHWLSFLLRIFHFILMFLRE